jgi:hypothetical protein
MSMIKEAIQYVVGLSKQEILNAHGKSYSTGELERLPAPDALAKTFTVHSLSGFVDYTKASKEPRDSALVLVDGPREVFLMSPLFGDFKQRDIYIKAEPFFGKGFPFGRYLDIESFVIGIQTSFVQDDHTSAILKMVGNVQAGAIKTVEDDGVSQQVTVRKGVTKVDHAVVVSPVELRPFRTFQDIDQPSSGYVLRLDPGDHDDLPTVGLWEVDDQLWRLTAVRDIKKYLDKTLENVLVLA